MNVMTVAMTSRPPARSKEAPKEDHRSGDQSEDGGYDRDGAPATGGRVEQGFAHGLPALVHLFDFIEEMHERGETMREALLDAGLMRLRPVLITVVATVLGLIPLAIHGGPLWEPLCYAQVGGLSFATVITLILVPVLYTIFVRDLKWIRWDEPGEHKTELHEVKLPSTGTKVRGAGKK